MCVLIVCSRFRGCALQYNPCEQIFARTKRYLKDERGDLSFKAEILEAFGCVSYVDVVNFYDECIEKPLRD